MLKPELGYGVSQIERAAACRPGVIQSNIEEHHSLYARHDVLGMRYVCFVEEPRDTPLRAFLSGQAGPVESFDHQLLQVFRPNA